MRKLSFILTVILCSLGAKAQVIFKTIVPKQVVIAGESFSVQYVLDDIEKDNEFTPPIFKGFRLVSGPYTYNGSVNTSRGSSPFKNIVFTLVAPKPGNFFIPGATAKINGKLIKSDDVIIEVITKKEAFERSAKEENNASEYFLQPGEDPYEKMRKNLFMKVWVDKTSCYVGEPVVATFKLYSRLESKSDIVKNPGFYGFTVQDMVSLNDNIVATETLNGKAFDVHTIRTVQLYPLQAGSFIIDPMEVINKVEFSKSAVYKKPEQEITEGVVDNNDPPAKNNTITYENHISTEKITINVKPYPVAKKPVAFNGATGNFSLHASLKKNELAKNEEGSLIITISGRGNFTQLTAPAVQWPQGIESFEPVINDSLDKLQVPLRGSRTFRFPFIAGMAGNYNAPVISFTFFDPDSNHYKTISSSIPGIRITSEEIKGQPKKQETTGNINKHDQSSVWLFGSIFLVVIIIILLQLRKTKKERSPEEKLPEAGTVVSLEQLLKPVQFSLVADDGSFYTLLQKTIWEYLGLRLQLSGGKMNKRDLQKAMKAKNFTDGQYNNILNILEECEAAVFTKAELAHDKQELLNRAKLALEQIRD